MLVCIGCLDINGVRGDRISGIFRVIREVGGLIVVDVILADGSDRRFGGREFAVFSPYLDIHDLDIFFVFI